MDENKALPDGIEWPRFEDETPVRFGDTGLDAYGRPRPVMSVKFTQAGFAFIGDDMGGIWWDNGAWPMEDLEVDPGKRVKRPVPKVLASDGEPLEVGQTVWLTDGRGPWEVSRIVNADRWRVIADDEENGHLNVYPENLTHQRPVLDADGVPINEGDTVWSIAGEGPFTVKSVNPDDDPDIHEDFVWCGELIFDNVPKHRIADQLTHTKPEPDTWERIEHDAKVIDETIESEWGGVCTDARDLVRRCRALVERERGE